VAVILPPSRSLGTLTAAIAGRVSCRRFSGAELTLEELSAVLVAAYGRQGNTNGSRVHEDGAGRPVPSAGARYPLEIHLIVSSVAELAPCTYRYVPSRHQLIRTGGMISPEAVGELFLGQTFLTTASAVAVVTATLGPSLARYGDRGYRYVLLEAGHVAQNLNLAASALRLASLNLGGFWDQSLGRALGLTEYVPLYGVALGRASTTDVQEVRQPVDAWP
jgi:SagB-type dehydrogenase family enzyme